MASAQQSFNIAHDVQNTLVLSSSLPYWAALQEYEEHTSMKQPRQE